MKHGPERFFIKGIKKEIKEIKGSLFPKKPKTQPDPIDPPEEKQPPKLQRMFCRLFQEGSQPEAEGLIELGLAMETETGVPSNSRDSNIPAGYTYLGQFIDHDITRDEETELTKTGDVDPEDMKNFRSPALDLDSVYGGGPGAIKDSRLFEPDGKKLRIGKTSPADGIGALDNDLPRTGTTADIGDHRNDENLAVAQTHLAFLKFHNAKLAESPSSSFEAVRKQVVLHYQAIILSDFLPRVVDPIVLKDVLNNGRRFYTDDMRECMPVEFSVAAYRMGHSMVRPSYEWNRIFSTGGPSGIATFDQIFEFSGGSGSRGEGDPPFRGLPTLPSNWIIDWRRLYQLSGIPSHPQLNFARQLDAQMAMDLKTLPEFQQMVPRPPDEFLSLATRNLLRGRLVSLPTGQDVAKAMGLSPLSAAEITNEAPGQQPQILRKHGFDEATPLWHYILREAKVKAGGNHLGPVGSRIIAETFIGLIEHSQTNIRSEQPGLTFSMSELLTFVGDLNPLGD